MERLQAILKYIVTSFAIASVIAWAGVAGAAAQDQADLDDLFARLADVGPQEAAAVESEIALELARSGSDAMDLLFERGEAALEAQEIDLAIAHFTALADHAPEFPAAYNGRATAYYLAGLYGPAIRDIARVLTLEPRHFGALSGLALILEETGEEARALEVLREIEAIHPHMDGLSARIERLELALTGAAL